MKYSSTPAFAIAALARAMSASTAAKSFHATGPEQAGRCWNGEANWLSSCASSGNSGSPVPRGGVRLALEAGEAVDDMDGVVGAALLAVVDDVEAGRALPGDHAGDRLGTAASSAARSAAALLPGEQQLDHLGRPRQAAGVGGENPCRAAPHVRSLLRSASPRRCGISLSFGG